ncbi:MAG: acetylornithine/succinyldiaminopimelate/putrescine aminotransferase [Paraglaciecola sp.]|jgi:acetylornithine/succinyldiaminopimelate/putrescine aminotransferase
MSYLRNLFLQHVAQTSDEPLMLEVERAKGVYLYDPNGKEYLDLISGIGVSGIGHCHPKVIEAIQKQTEKYLHTLVYGEYILSPQVKLAKLLTDNLPDSLNSVYFVNSGSEATEGAMKLAKRYTGRSEIIACRNAYHGSTQGAASLMSPTTFTQAFYPLLPDIRHMEFNCERCFQKITTKTACVIVETVQGEWGVRQPIPGYLKKLRERCDEVGALLILDEIQAGYGRTGTLFAFEQYDIVPDILLLAKGMGGGMPIGAFVAKREVMNTLTFDPVLGHITTFGGHPVSCAAGLATLEILLTENHISEVKKKEQLFHELLVHPAILDVRSAGLLIAAELADYDFMKKVQMIALEKGVITDWFLFNERSLRIAPPLIITEEEIRFACGVLVEAIETVANE